MVAEKQKRKNNNRSEKRKMTVGKKGKKLVIRRLPVLAGICACLYWTRGVAKIPNYSKNPAKIHKFSKIIIPESDRGQRAPDSLPNARWARGRRPSPAGSTRAAPAVVYIFCKSAGRHVSIMPSPECAGECRRGGGDAAGRRSSSRALSASIHGRTSSAAGQLNAQSISSNKIKTALTCSGRRPRCTRVHNRSFEPHCAKAAGRLTWPAQMYLQARKVNLQA